MEEKLAKYKTISLLLTIIALFLYSLSLVSIRFNVGNYGLLPSLPLTFYLSLLFLFAGSVIISFSRRAFLWLTWVQISILLVIIWLTPFLVGNMGAMTPNVPLDYYAMADSVIQSGHINPALFAYLNWPGLMILTAFSQNIIGDIQPELIVSLTPFILQIVIFIIFYILAQQHLGNWGKNIWILGAWTIVLINWSPENKYSSQAMALILLLTLFILLNKHIGRMSVNSILITILLFSCIVITHFLTTIAATIFLIIYLLIYYRAKFISFISFIIIIFFFWTIYGCVLYFNNNISGYLQTVFKLDIISSLFLHSNVFQPSTSQANILVNRMQFYDVIIFLCITVLGIALSVFKMEKGKIALDKTVFIFTAAIICLIPFTLYVYKLEIIYRVLWLCLPVMGYFALKLFRTKLTRALWIGALIIALPVFLISVYGGMSATYIPPEETASKDFLIKSTEGGKVILLHRAGLGFACDASKFSYIQYDARIYPAQYQDDEYWLRYIDELNNDNKYVVVSITDNLFYQYVIDAQDFTNKYTALLSDHVGFNVIYAIRGVSIFYTK